MTPSGITVSADRASVRITWDDGSAGEFAAEFTASALRDLCQSAGSKRLALQGLAVPAADTLRIADVSPVGRYGINIVFSDDHDRGIYPWSMLYEYARKNLCTAAINCGNDAATDGTIASNDTHARANGI